MKADLWDFLNHFESAYIYIYDKESQGFVLSANV